MVNRVIRKSFYITLILVGALLLSGNAFAEDDTIFSITVNPSLNLSVSKAISGFSVTPSKNGTYDSDSFNVISSTNNATGYTLIMSVDGTDLVSETINVNTGDPLIIPTLTKTQDGISAEAFAASTDAGVLNRYGVSIAGANYNAMEVEKEIKKTTENNSSSDTTAISLAAKLNLLTVPAVYSRTINFEMTANAIDPVQPYPVDPCIADPDCNHESGITLQGAYEMAYTAAHKGMYEEITPGSNTYQYIDSWNGVQYQGQGRDVRFLIQDMTTEICSTATVIGSTALVLDVRDQTSYHIVKAADGRCWMQDNLALDAVVNKANLTPSNTNASQDAIDNYKTGGNTKGYAGWTANAVSYEIDDGGDYPINLSIINPYINVQHKNMLPVTNAYTGTDESMASSVSNGGWKAGVFYNYCAASIGTFCYNAGGAGDDPIEIEYDICPSAWRMPTGGDYLESGEIVRGGEFEVLYEAYPTITGGENQYVRLRKALRIPLAGYSFEGEVESGGSSAVFWSSTFYGDAEYDTYDLWFSEDYGGGVSSSRDARYGGQSIRCIAK